MSLTSQPAGRTNASLSPKQQAAARAVAEQIVNVGLTSVDRDRWRRCGEPGDHCTQDEIDSLHDVFAQAKRITQTPPIISLSQAARAVTVALEAKRQQGVADLHSSLDRMRARIVELETALAERDAHCAFLESLLNERMVAE